MYDKQILADYFKGKRGKDAEVQRQFELLRRQAEIDCRDLRKLGDTRVTLESIEEDYIYNVQRIAETQGRNEPAGSATAKSVLRVVFLSMIGPVILSAIGPIYYGYTNGPYWRVIVWALAVVVPLLWWARSSFKHALSTAPQSIIGRASLTVAIIVMMAGVLVIGGTHCFISLRGLCTNDDLTTPATWQCWRQSAAPRPR